MSRIINLRGTSGSGKSFIALDLMRRYQDRQPHFIEGRKQPVSYTCHRWLAGPPLCVIGHYEGGDGSCGGADNISAGLESVYQLIHEASAQGSDCLFEGLIVSSDYRRCIELRHTNQLLVIGLDTSLATCNQAVDARRAARAIVKGKEPAPLKVGKDGLPKNTQAKFKALLSQRKYFRDIAGLDFRVLDRKAALDACVAFLELEAPRTTSAVAPEDDKPLPGGAE